MRLGGEIAKPHGFEEEVWTRFSGIWESFSEDYLAC